VDGWTIDAIDVRAILREAAEDGVDRPRIELNTMRAGAGKIRATCRCEMALRLLCAWIEVAARTPTNERGARTLHAARTAAAEIYAAYDDVRNPRQMALAKSGYVGPG
jgi:hypothetical protein